MLSTMARSFSCVTDQDSHHTKKCNVSEIVTEAFELATELGSQDASTDARPSNELVSVKIALAIAMIEEKKARDQLALLMQKHGTSWGYFRR